MRLRRGRQRATGPRGSASQRGIRCRGSHEKKDWGKLGLDTGLFFRAWVGSGFQPSGSGWVVPEGSGSGQACIFQVSGL